MDAIGHVPCCPQGFVGVVVPDVDHEPLVVVGASLLLIVNFYSDIVVVVFNLLLELLKEFILAVQQAF